MNLSNTPKILILAALLMLTPLAAQNVIVTIGDVTVDGYTADVEVPVMLSNPNDAVGGIQFDIEVTPGIVPLFGVDATGDAAGFTGDFSTLGEDLYRIILFSAAGSDSIAAGSDMIMILHLDGSAVLSAQLDLLISNLIVSDASGNTISSSGSNGSITIGHVVSLSLTDGSGDVEEAVSITVDMINGGEVSGVQFDLLDTPNYLSITDITPTDRTTGFTISTTDIGSGTRVLLYGSAGEDIAAGTGAILTIDYTIYYDAYAFDVSTYFENVVVSADNGDNYWIAALDSGVITVFPGYMEEPHNLVATSDLDGMIPLAWDAPYGPVGGDIEEDFETGALPDDWTMTTNSAIGWFVTQDGSSTFWTIPSHTWYACSNDDAANDDGSVDYLITPSLRTTGATDFQLSFASFFTGTYSQTAHVEVSTDGVNFTEVYTLQANAEWVNETVDLNDYVNEEEFYIAFHSNDNGIWASGWAIDDIMISFSGARYARNIHFDFNELGQWVITADKAEVVERFPNGLIYQQLVDWENPLEPQSINREIPVSAYHLYRTIDGTNYDLIATVGPDELTYLDEDVMNGIIYSYYVTADYSPEGTESGPSNIASATPIEWVEISLSDGAALSGTTDTLEIFVNNESEVSAFYFEIQDVPNVLIAQEIIATDRTTGWFLNVIDLGETMQVTGGTQSNNITAGSGAVCRIVVLASSLDPTVADLIFTAADILNSNGNSMIWTDEGEGATFEVTVETQYLMMPSNYGNPGDMITIPLLLKNTQDVYGIEVDFSDNLNYLQGSAIIPTSDHDFSTWIIEGIIDDGVYHVFLYDNPPQQNPIPQGTLHIADIVFNIDAFPPSETLIDLIMSEVLVADGNALPIYVETSEPQVYIGTPDAIYSYGEVDLMEQTITIDLENTSTVNVLDLYLLDAPNGIAVTNVTAVGRLSQDAINPISGEQPEGTARILAYDPNGISVGSGPIIEISYEENMNTDFDGDVIFIFKEVSSSIVVGSDLIPIPSIGAGYAFLDPTLDIELDQPVVPTHIALHPAFPNPFNPLTTIQYDLIQSGAVDLKIYNLMGREIRTLSHGFEFAGRKSVRWDALDNNGQNVSTGMYIIRLETAGQIHSQKLIYLK